MVQAHVQGKWFTGEWTARERSPREAMGTIWGLLQGEN